MYPPAALPALFPPAGLVAPAPCRACPAARPPAQSSSTALQPTGMRTRNAGRSVEPGGLGGLVLIQHRRLSQNLGPLARPGICSAWGWVCLGWPWMGGAGASEETWKYVYFEAASLKQTLGAAIECGIPQPPWVEGLEASRAWGRPQEWRQGGFVFGRCSRWESYLPVEGLGSSASEGGILLLGSSLWHPEIAEQEPDLGSLLRRCSVGFQLTLLHLENLFCAWNNYQISPLMSVSGCFLSLRFYEHISTRWRGSLSLGVTPGKVIRKGSPGPPGRWKHLAVALQPRASGARALLAGQLDSLPTHLSVCHTAGARPGRALGTGPTARGQAESRTGTWTRQA